MCQFEKGSPYTPPSFSTKNRNAAAAGTEKLVSIYPLSAFHLSKQVSEFNKKTDFDIARHFCLYQNLSLLLLLLLLLPLLPPTQPPSLNDFCISEQDLFDKKFLIGF